MKLKRATRAASGILAGVASILVAALLRLFPSAAELFATTLGPAVAWVLSGLSSRLGFALSELLLFGALVGLPLRAIWGTWRMRREGCGFLRIAGRGALVTLNVAGWIVAAFLWSWGFHYSRAPLEERWELPAADPARLEELSTLLVDLGNAYYVDLHGSEDAGSMTTIEDVRALDTAVEAAFEQVGQDLRLDESVAWTHHSAKTPRISPLMNRLGISGFYFPWTGEANVNGELPAIAYAHALAHEKAHQRGFAPEDEANFLAILAGAAAEHGVARYAAILFAQRQLLRTLLRSDAERGRELLERRHPGVQRDVDELSRFWQRYRGRAREWAHRSNDLYLRSQRVEGGVASYAGSAELLLRFASTAAAFPPRPETGSTQ